MPARAPLALAALLAWALAAGPAAADVWQWTDSRGIVRYTPDPDTIPGDRRGTMVRVEPGMAVPPPDPLTSPPTTTYAPPDDVQFSADPFNAPSQAHSVRSIPGPGGAAASPAAAADAAAAELATRLRGAHSDETRRIITRRFEVERMIARDEERVKQIISSQPTPMDGPDAHPPEIDAELRQIARRLPALQAELKSLEAEQTRLERR